MKGIPTYASLLRRNLSPRFLAEIRPALVHYPRNRKVFSSVTTYCMFVGYPRSGSTLVGAMLDAHPKILIANEARALRFVRRGLSRGLVYSILVESNQSFAKADYQGFGGYTYHIPGQHQGRLEPVRVIGDKRGYFPSSDMVDLEQLVELVSDVRLVHTVRNPFDSIATHSKKPHTKGSLQDIVEDFFDVASALRVIHAYPVVEHDIVPGQSPGQTGARGAR